MCGGTLILIVIMCKYIHSRLNLMSWNVVYGSRRGTQLTDSELGQQFPVIKRNIYDRWLLLRFTVAFLALAAFQVLIILFEVGSARSIREADPQTGPDLSLEKLRGDLVQFMPGTAPCLLTFLVFGTTRALREYMWDKLIPRSIKRRFERVEPEHELTRRRTAMVSGKSTSHQTDTLRQSSAGESSRSNGETDGYQP
ncbi:hypothetical protein jhhlp_003652 [Lomentospora prolificans]|uniref:Uncharacterized protein n=1 Tax=Lomentospora prolificans TaxID=41688 RepID=A0A2N3N9C0_9PEZI|nr:hypothetical protein jhhlp_003652 [Lomentospora prolificans]